MENWTEHAWQFDSNTHADTRSEHIDERIPCATTRDVALFSDDSCKEGDGATYSAQPRRFGNEQD